MSKSSQDISKKSIRKCPACSWSSNVRMCHHILNANDDAHNKWLELLVTRYHTDISARDLSELREYRTANVTWVMIRDILTEMGELRTRNSITHSCPCCSWTGTQKFNNHLDKMISQGDIAHQNFKREIIEMHLSGVKPAEILSNFNVEKTLLKSILASEDLLKSQTIRESQPE